jgi:hypothetical protein
MTYQASIVHAGKPLSSRQSANQNQLLAWLLTELESSPYNHTSGVIENLSNKHESPRIYTGNAHFD